MAKIRNLQVTGYGNFQGPGWLDVKRYGAKGNNLDDDRTAINNALLAAQTTGGTVYFPPGVYRLNSGQINGQPSVSMVGHPSSAVIYQNHASNNTLVYQLGPQEYALQSIKNINFQANVANSGTVISNSSGTSSLLIENCTINAGSGGPWNFNGDLINIAGASRVYIQDSLLRVNGSTAAALNVANNGAEVHATGNTIIMPVTYTGIMVAVTQGTTFIDGNYFDCTAHNSGTAYNIGVLASANTHCQNITNNNFFMDGGPQTFGLFADANAWVRASGNSYDGTIQRVNAGFLLIGSTLDLYDLSYGVSGGTTMTLPDMCAAFHASFSSTAPTITMPFKQFPGQEMVVTIRNSGASFWSGIGVSGMDGPLIAGAGVAGGQAVTFRARVSTLRSNGSNYVWSMIGQYSIGFTTT